MILHTHNNKRHIHIHTYIHTARVFMAYFFFLFLFLSQVKNGTIGVFCLFFGFFSCSNLKCQLDDCDNRSTYIKK